MKALSIAAILCVACSGAQHRPPRSRLSVKEIVERSKPAIVRIESTAGDKGQVGTGFAIDPSGIIATNLHVVAGVNEIKVTLLDGHAYAVERILNVDLERDLALIQIAVDDPMPSLTLGDSDKMEPGDPVVAIGNPLGFLDYTVSDGLISSVRQATERTTILQTSAPISQGSSGGPLFNAFGEVIGVATMIALEGQNLNFAMPSKYLMPLLAAPHPMTVAELFEATKAPEPEGPKIVRAVPNHDVAVLDGCTTEQIGEVYIAILETIKMGAPLYNDGKFAECFAIYRGTSEHFSRDGGCEGVRQAFSDGLDRAKTLETPNEKAWALRDTFDGLVDVIGRWDAMQPKQP